MLGVRIIKYVMLSLIASSTCYSQVGFNWFNFQEYDSTWRYCFKVKNDHKHIEGLIVKYCDNLLLVDCQSINVKPESELLGAQLFLESKRFIFFSDINEYSRGLFDDMSLKNVKLLHLSSVLEDQITLPNFIHADSTILMIGDNDGRSRNICRSSFNSSELRNIRNLVLCGWIKNYEYFNKVVHLKILGDTSVTRNIKINKFNDLSILEISNVTNLEVLSRYILLINKHNELKEVLIDLTKYDLKDILRLFCEIDQTRNGELTIFIKVKMELRTKLNSWVTNYNDSSTLVKIALL